MCTILPQWGRRRQRADILEIMKTTRARREARRGGAAKAALIAASVAPPIACALAASEVHAQSLAIPLQYVPVTLNSGPAYRLAVNVGINGGPAQPYLFDTGSNLFNAAYNPATWNGFSTGQTNGNTDGGY